MEQAMSKAELILPEHSIQASKARVEKATIRILRPDDHGVLQPVAQGVLVPGGYILTAAHCINWVGTGSMALGDWYIETIQTADGTQFKVSPCAAEPMADIAVLAAADDQEMCGDYSAFQEFCDATEPAPVSTDDFPYECRFEPFEVINPPVPIHVLTHKGQWVTGSARRFNTQPAGNVAVLFDTQIEGVAHPAAL
jgi:hypothetical protein